MGTLGSITVLLFAGWAALSPVPMAWCYIAVVALFELWLLRRVTHVGSAAVLAGEPPYHFSEEEAALVQRYRFYFTYPALARDCSSILAAIGLTALGLAPWLTFKRADRRQSACGGALYEGARAAHGATHRRRARRPGGAWHARSARSRVGQDPRRQPAQ